MKCRIKSCDEDAVVLIPIVKVPVFVGQIAPGWPKYEGRCEKHATGDIIGEVMLEEEH